MAARLCRWTKQEYPGCNVPCSLRHAGAKALKQRVLDVLLPLQGVACRFGLPRASLRLPWAMEVIGLSARMASVSICGICGRINHPACSLAHCALICRPQISPICTDAVSLRMRKNRDPLRRWRIKNQAAGSGARVNDP